MKINKLKFFLCMLFVTLLMDLLPSVGFISIGSISITMMHLPTILTAIFAGTGYGMIMGCSFGIISQMHALARDVGTLDIFLKNPIVSVLPRIMVAVVASLTIIALKKIFKGKYMPFCAGIAGLLGSITNTCLVFVSLSLVYLDEMLELFEISTLAELRTAIFGIIKINGTIEAVVGMIICSVFTFAFRKLHKTKGMDFISA